MKRKNREAKVNKERPRNIANIIVFVVFVLLLITAIFYLKYLLSNLDYFRVKDVVVNSGSRGDFSYLKGRNIFDIDVIQEAEHIFQAYPGYKKIKIIRVLPNRLVIIFLKRQPLAIVKLYRLFSIDDEQVLFETGNESALTDLPLISGLETRIFGPKAGTRYNMKELAQAIEIIKSIQNNRILKDYKIKNIEINHASYLTCLISVPGSFVNNQKQSVSGFDILQVRFSPGQTQDKLDLLSELFSQIKNDLSRVSYIDLRFKEPVIKFKDDKK